MPPVVQVQVDLPSCVYFVPHFHTVQVIQKSHRRSPTKLRSGTACITEWSPPHHRGFGPYRWNHQCLARSPVEPRTVLRDKLQRLSHKPLYPVRWLTAAAMAIITNENTHMRHTGDGQSFYDSKDERLRTYLTTNISLIRSVRPGVGWRLGHWDSEQPWRSLVVPFQSKTTHDWVRS